MARCSYCNSLLLFGGTKTNAGTFCNAKCQRAAVYLGIARQIPDHDVDDMIRRLDAQGCPKCHGPGPLEVHTSHRIWSALLLTSWSSKPIISCRGCGRNEQALSAGICMFVGWWGFPWGLIMTPVQITRNFVGMLQAPPHPSPQLKKIVSLMLAEQIVALHNQRSAATPPPFSPSAASLPPIPPPAPPVS
jgi:hypothetical protein